MGNRLPLSVRRRWEFWVAALRGLMGRYGALLDALAVLTVVLVLFGLNQVAGYAGAFAGGAVVVIVLLGEAAYQEWNQWAPHDPPDVVLTPDRTESGVSLMVLNRDTRALFRASVTQITGPNGQPLPASVAQPQGFPWDLRWDGGGIEAWIGRGEDRRLLLVTFDLQAVAQLYGGHQRRQGNPYVFLFPSPNGPDHVLDEHKPEDANVFQVHVRMNRSDPDGLRQEVVELTLPQNPVIWRQMYISGG
jgi:hypothetical protein